MKHILIDTCSWINLIDHKKENPQIEKLDFWIKEKLIEIIVPELIIQEWNEHKSNEKKRIHEQWNTKQKHFTEIAKLYGNLPLVDFNVELTFVDNQINTIDRIIQSTTNKVFTSDDVKLIIPDKQIKPKEAPFHHKDDSTKDAYIYFSSLEFCKRNGIDQLYFYSDNSSDFGKPLPEKKGSKTEIHPDLLKDFPEVNVIYYADIGRAISELSKELPNPLNNDVSEVSQDDTCAVFIDKDKAALDQIYDYISYWDKELSFIPLHIFKNNFPFKINDDFTPYYSLFSLITNNEELFDLFDNIKFTDGNEVIFIDEKYCKGIINAKDKIKFVLNALNQNLIFNISNKQSRKEINIRGLEKETCHCPKCNFRRLSFVSSFNALGTYTGDLKDLKKKAHLLYLLGNFVEASETQKLVHSLAIKERCYLSAFISQHNLSKLSVCIKNNYWGKNHKGDLVKELDDINLANVSSRYETPENKQLIKWIRESDFYTRSRDSIQSIVSNIQDNYYKQLNGGWSSNSYVWQLINTYAELESFLNGNCVIYDKFEGFYDLSNTFFEGIFASHSISESTGNTRLNSFDDWLIIQLINYGNADNINKLISRYKLKNIKYVETSTNGDTFDILINNFFLNNSNLREEFFKINEEGNDTFWEFYNKVFCNLLTVISICDFSSSYLNKTTMMLLSYLESEDYIDLSNYKYIRFYFERLGKKLSNCTISRYFTLVINSSNYHSESFFESIANILYARKEQIEISETEFESIYNLLFEKSKDVYSNSLAIPVYQIIKNEPYRVAISNRILELLTEKFNLNLFYQATIYDIIEFHDEFFNSALELSYPNNNHTSFKSFFSGHDNKRYNKVNQLINLCFKFNINTATKNYSKYKELDNYYEWLLNMEGFDYLRFDPKWVEENPIRYYYKTIAQSKKTKLALDTYLKNNHDSKLERIYLEIYVLKSWDV